MPLPDTVIGQCSLCQGNVTLPADDGIDIPSAQCSDCGAVPVQPYTAVIQMDLESRDFDTRQPAQNSSE